MNEELKEIFAPAFKPPFLKTKTNSFSVTAKFHPYDRSVCSYKCNGECSQAFVNVIEINSFAGTVSVVT